MNITNVKVTPLNGDGKTKAMASITIDECFVVTGLKIMEGTNGLFVSMPSRKWSDNEYHDIAYPIDKSTREAIRDIVLDKYKGQTPTVVDDDELPF